MDYETRRERLATKVLAWLFDMHNADPGKRCASVNEIRSYLHQSSARSMLTPVIARLVNEGWVETKRDMGVIYFTEKLVKEAETP